MRIKAIAVSLVFHNCFEGDSIPNLVHIDINIISIELLVALFLMNIENELFQCTYFKNFTYENRGLHWQESCNAIHITIQGQ